MSSSPVAALGGHILRVADRRGWQAEVRCLLQSRRNCRPTMALAGSEEREPQTMLASQDAAKGGLR